MRGGIFSSETDAGGGKKNTRVSNLEKDLSGKRFDLRRPLLANPALVVLKYSSGPFRDRARGEMLILFGILMNLYCIIGAIVGAVTRDPGSNPRRALGEYEISTPSNSLT